MVVHCLGCLVSCFGAQPLEFDEGRMPPSGTPAVAEIPTAPLYEPLVARLLRGTNANPVAIAGALLAFCGVAILSL